MRRTLAEAWDRFWFAPADPEVLTLFRVALGGYLIALLTSLAPNWRLYHGLDGTMSFGDPLLPTHPEDWWSIIVWTRHLVPVETYWAATFVAAIAFTVGWRTRMASIALFVLHTSIVNSSPSTANGEDQVLRILLFYSCFLDFESASHLRRPERWPLRLIQITTCLIYVFTQTNKLVWEELWRNGQVMYLLSHSPVWGRFPWPLPQLFQAWWATALATWGSLAIEIGFSVLVWAPRLRLAMIGLLSVLHLVIATCIVGATFFNLVMLVCMCAFLSGEDFRRIRTRPASRS